MARARLWLSVKPQFADAIIAGIKLCELRRIPPRVKPGALVVLYASAPTKALVGAFRLADVVIHPLDKLWELVAGRVAINKLTYYSYFHGKKEGAALMIGEAWAAVRPKRLIELRQRWPGFCPPVSYRYLSPESGFEDITMPLVSGPTLRVLPHRSRCL